MSDTQTPTPDEHSPAAASPPSAPPPTAPPPNAPPPNAPPPAALAGHPVREAVVRRHPVLGAVWGILVGLGLAFVLIGQQVIAMGTLAPFAVVVVGILLGVVWGLVAPARDRTAA